MEKLQTWIKGPDEEFNKTFRNIAQRQFATNLEEPKEDVFPDGRA
jgi:hypothetical protein